MKNRALNPGFAFALCYAAMVCLAIAVNLMPIFLTTLRVDLGGRDGLTGNNWSHQRLHLCRACWGHSLDRPLGRSMGRQAVQYPRNSADRCWARAPGQLTRIFHGPGCGVRDGPRRWDSGHGAQSHRRRSAATQPRNGLELVAFFLWNRNRDHGPGGYVRISIGHRMAHDFPVFCVCSPIRGPRIPQR